MYVCIWRHYATMSKSKPTLINSYLKNSHNHLSFYWLITLIAKLGLSNIIKWFLYFYSNVFFMVHEMPRQQKLCSKTQRANILLMGEMNHMMTSSNGNIIRVTGPLCGEFTGHQWIPCTKASEAELWCFLWFAPELTVGKNSWGWWFQTPSRSLWRYCNESYSREAQSNVPIESRCYHGSILFHCRSPCGAETQFPHPPIHGSCIQLHHRYWYLLGPHGCPTAYHLPGTGSRYLDHYGLRRHRGWSRLCRICHGVPSLWLLVLVHGDLLWTSRRIYTVVDVRLSLEAWSRCHQMPACSNVSFNFWAVWVRELYLWTIQKIMYWYTVTITIYPSKYFQGFLGLCSVVVKPLVRGGFM